MQNQALAVGICLISLIIAVTTWRLWVSYSRLVAAHYLWVATLFLGALATIVYDPFGGVFIFGLGFLCAALLSEGCS